MREKRTWLPQLIISLMLLWALYPENPYGYYVLLRWAACSVFIYLTLTAIKQKEAVQVWPLGIAALIYNPLLNIPGIVSDILSDDSIQDVINMLAIGVLFVNALAQIDSHNGKRRYIICNKCKSHNNPSLLACHSCNARIDNNGINKKLEDVNASALELNDLRKINPALFDFFKTVFGQKVALILIAGFVLLFVLSISKNS